MTEGRDGRVVVSKHFLILPYEIWDRTDISGAEKLVFISLCRHYNYEKGLSWPSLPTIAEEADFSPNWIRQKCLPHLAEIGLIQIVKESGKVNRYKIPALSGDPVTQLPTPRNSVTEYPVSELPTPRNSVTPNNMKEQNNINKMKEQDISVPCVVEKAKRKTPPKKNQQFEAEFEAVYEIYPYSPHNEKTRARKNFIKLREKGISLDDLKLATSNYAQTRKNEDPQFTKNAGNFYSERQGIWKNYLDYVPATVEAEEEKKPNLMEAARKAGLL